MNNLETQFSKNKLDDNQKKYLEKSIILEKARFYLEENQLEKGISLLEKEDFLENIDNHDFNELKIDQLTTIGNLYFKKKELIKAEDFFQKALKMINQHEEENSYSKINVLFGLSKTYFLKNEHQKAVTVAEEAMGYVKRFDNLYFQAKITQQLAKSYSALNNIEEYKSTNANFFEIQTEIETREQQYINMAYNLISDEFDSEYIDEKNNYLNIVYVISGILLLVILSCIIFWQKVVQRKNSLNEVVNYIEITRSNLLSNFSITDKKQEPKKNLILKETELHILNKLKRFESSKRFLNKDISLAVLAGQLDGFRSGE